MFQFFLFLLYVLIEIHSQLYHKLNITVLYNVNPFKSSYFLFTHSFLKYSLWYSYGPQIFFLHISYGMTWQSWQILQALKLTSEFISPNSPSAPFEMWNFKTINCSVGIESTCIHTLIQAHTHTLSDKLRNPPLIPF